MRNYMDSDFWHFNDVLSTYGVLFVVKVLAWDLLINYMNTDQSLSRKE